ncbi:hypothetical protein P175DRAFT_0498533 [Aspergillus ochraceoroseus IBT 24754]|uniref:Uncharacterized protein n=2 Tax=Aspergillus ochraceoroseus TaxID=138278 RepID=A0A2T5MA69_9EURO|nr:uncharacterized protein P175DRAFT_0498533 [Aspergillus ochraceoroseus IBT 24754]KKK12332.1 hypothetical protein AOCH_004274 [Aspergillus ochraceoroseus]PTU25420.1 hypothetical protein P175DRAFT_0498533 [Aspergillus ochraceoroseus IBT 24754]
MAVTPRTNFTREHYTIGWICMLEVEFIAALSMLDEQHGPLPVSTNDRTDYVPGRIGPHNVVIVPLQGAGNALAAGAMAKMRMTFPNITSVLLVGIGGGVPVETDAGMIRLGDVVVGEPSGRYPGVVQYDHGKLEAGEFQHTGFLAPPPERLLVAARELDARRATMPTDPILEHLRRMVDSTVDGPSMLSRYPGLEKDHLYSPGYVHQGARVPCDQSGCSPLQRVQRPTDAAGDRERSPVVHRGNIASAERVMKSGLRRDQIAEQYDIICFEMEAAGVLADWPCLVIRGISDYSDSHKNDDWQPYAAATAAAYARQLCFHIPSTYPVVVEQQTTILYQGEMVV